MPETETGRRLTVIGSGSVTVEPNIASVTLGVQASAPSVKEAVDANSDTMSAVFEALKAAGVSSDDIHTQHFSVYEDRSAPREAASSGGPVAGFGGGSLYRVDNTVTVVIRDIDRAGAVIDSALTAGANTVRGVTFTVEDRSEPAARARVLALEDAQRKAEEIAGAAGLGVGRIIAIRSGEDTASPLRSMSAEGFGGVGPFNPGNLNVYAHVEVTFELKQQGR